jgi:hypothetical protein
MSKRNAGGLKKIEWANPNKMKFESGHKLFDRQTNYLSTGNVIANTQFSSFIRAGNCTVSPVGEHVPEGVLQDFDLNPFKGLPRFIREFIRKVGKDKSVIMYELRHWYGRTKVVDGYVVTDADYKHLKTFYINKRARNAVDEALKYFSVALVNQKKEVVL